MVVLGEIRIHRERERHKHRYSNGYRNIWGKVESNSVKVGKSESESERPTLWFQNTMTTVDSYTDITSTYLGDQFRNLLRTKHIIRTPYG